MLLAVPSLCTHVTRVLPLALTLNEALPTLWLVFSTALAVPQLLLLAVYRLAYSVPPWSQIAVPLPLASKAIFGAEAAFTLSVSIAVELGVLQLLVLAVKRVSQRLAMPSCAHSTLVLALWSSATVGAAVMSLPLVSSSAGVLHALPSKRLA